MTDVAELIREGLLLLEGLFVLIEHEEMTKKKSVVLQCRVRDFFVLQRVDEVVLMLDDELGGEKSEQKVQLLRAEELEAHGAEHAVPVALRLDDRHFHSAADARLALVGVRRTFEADGEILFLTVLLDGILHFFCV